MRPLKILLIILGASSALSLIFTGPIPSMLQWLNPHMWLGLSKWGLEHYLWWQVVTYALVPPLDSEVSLSFLVNTFFTCYLLWTVGSSLIAQRGARAFWTLLTGSVLIGGLVTSGVMLATDSLALLAGWTPALYGLLIGWMLLNPHARVLLLFAIPMRVVWVVIGGAAITLYLDLASGHYVQFMASASSVLFGYLYAIIAWEIYSPFRALRRLENFLHKLRRKKSSDVIVDFN